MRTITLIVVHCSAVRPEQTSSAKQIDEWHRDRGFHNGIGYHFVVRRDGSIELGRLNSAGEPEDTRTPEQKRALRKKLEELHRMFPKALIVGHHDLNPGKDCPCFDVVREYRDLEPL